MDFESEFTALIKQRYSGWLKFVGSIMRSRLHDEAEDVLQTALLKAWKCRHQYQGKVPLVKWINTIIYNTAKSVLRLREPLLCGYASDIYPDTAIAPPKQETAAIAKDIYDKSMAMVSPPQQIGLAAWANDTLDTTTSTQKIQAFRARRELVKAFAAGA